MHDKTDSELGLKIRKILVEKGIETPMLIDNVTGWLDTPTQRNKIEEKFREIMHLLALDMSDDSLVETPKRVARMFTSEIYRGLDYANFPKITVIKNKMGYDEMIFEQGISVKSSCEHHFIVIDGIANVAYKPHEKVIGISKINRVVEFFSRRPQVQERLTEQIHATLCYLLDTPDVAVVINAVHYCVKHRGIEHVNAATTTSKLSGDFRNDPVLRQEIMSLARS